MLSLLFEHYSLLYRIKNNKLLCGLLKFTSEEEITGDASSISCVSFSSLTCEPATLGYRGTLDRRPRHSNVQHANTSPPPPPPSPPPPFPPPPLPRRSPLRARA